MSYTKHDFVDDMILTGQLMDEVEDGIVAATDTADAAVSTSEDQGLTNIEKENARANIEAVKVTLSGTTLVIE